LAFQHFKITIDKGGAIRIPAVFENPKNQKSVKIDILPDTGAMTTAIDNKFARQMGIDIESGIPSTINGIKDFYQHFLILKMGNLKPITTPVVIGAGEYNFSVNVIGTPTMLQFGNFRYQSGYVTIWDATTTQKQAAYVDAYLAARQYPGWYHRYGKRI
jgi:hypothetical protein